MDALDSSAYDETAQGEENYILAQNKLWVITGEVSDFSAQIAALTQQSAQVQAQLGAPTQIAAPQTGYFIRSTAAGRLNAGADDILALNTTDLQASRALRGGMSASARPRRGRGCWGTTASP